MAEQITELTHEQEKALYKLCVERGIELQHGKVTICDLRNHRHSSIYKNRVYQVHSDDKEYPWSKIYSDIWQAINKFVDIKTRIKAKR
jgi:hypothetical protein